MSKEETILSDKSATRHDATVNVNVSSCPGESSKGGAGKVAAGMAGGVLLGTLGAAAVEAIAGEAVSEPAVEEPVVEEPVVEEPTVEEPAEVIEDESAPEWVDDTVDIADSVDDDMSFSEAFRTAREEVGSGGAFVWRGNVYSTYTAEEWEEMSAEEKDEYNDHFDWSEFGAVTEDDDDEVDEVELLGVDADSESDYIVADYVLDDDVFLIDVDPEFDGDDEFDMLVSDFDGDGIIDDSDIIDLSDLDVSEELLASDLNVDDDCFEILDDSAFDDDMFV